TKRQLLNGSRNRIIDLNGSSRRRPIGRAKKSERGPLNFIGTFADEKRVPERCGHRFVIGAGVRTLRFLNGFRSRISGGRQHNRKNQRREQYTLSHPPPPERKPLADLEVPYQGFAELQRVGSERTASSTPLRSVPIRLR